jgi:hypothetical protein
MQGISDRSLHGRWRAQGKGMGEYASSYAHTLSKIPFADKLRFTACMGCRCAACRLRCLHMCCTAGVRQPRTCGVLLADGRHDVCEQQCASYPASHLRDQPEVGCGCSCPRAVLWEGVVVHHVREQPPGTACRRTLGMCMRLRVAPWLTSMHAFLHECMSRLCPLWCLVISAPP